MDVLRAMRHGRQADDAITQAMPDGRDPTVDTELWVMLVGLAEVGRLLLDLYAERLGGFPEHVLTSIMELAPPD